MVTNCIEVIIISENLSSRALETCIYTNYKVAKLH